MRGKTPERKTARNNRKRRTRARYKGEGERPRLCVFRSNKHLYVQVVDDKLGQTLVSASSLSAEMKAQEGKKSAKAVSERLGSLLAARCKEKGIGKVVFDRNGFIFHTNGVLAMLADAARKGGMDF